MTKECYGAVVDDEEIALNLISTSLVSCFKQYGWALHLDTFFNPKSFLADLPKKNYKVVFLDIDMPSIDGIEVAKKLQAINENTVIIFVSNCEGRVFESFSVHPFGFIRKSSFLKDVESLTKMFIASLEDEKDDGGKMEIKNADGVTIVKISQLVYIECKRDYQYFYIRGSKEPIKTKTRMHVLEDQLSKKGFIRIHQGFLVNYNFINRIGKNYIDLITGIELPMSRGKKQEVLTQYMRLNRNDQIIININQEKNQ